MRTAIQECQLAFRTACEPAFRKQDNSYVDFVGLPVLLPPPVTPGPRLTCPSKPQRSLRIPLLLLPTLVRHYVNNIFAEAIYLR